MERKLRSSGTKTIIVLLLLSFGTTLFVAPEAEAGAKSFILGGLLGAGVVLAWPTICGAVAGIVGGIGAAGAAVAGAVGAASGAVAVGGAAVGGAVAGAGAAAGAAVTTGFGAIGAGIAAITASPLFVPCLIAAVAIIAGILIYKWIKKRNAAKADNNGGRISDTSSGTTWGSSSSGPTPITTSGEVQGTVSTKSSGSSCTSLQASHDAYVAAYRRYTQLLGQENPNQSEIQNALSDLKAKESSYRSMLGNK
jgi:hypothetical protein